MDEKIFFFHILPYTQTEEEEEHQQRPVGRRELIHSAIACLWQCSFQTFFNLSDFCIYTEHAWLSLSLSPFFLLAINHFSRSACMFIIYVNCSHCSRESINVRRSQLRLPVLQIYLANKNQWIIHCVARMRKIIPIELWRLMLATL